MLNKVMVIGNLGSTPELRRTQGDQPVCDLSIATNRKFKDRSGELVEDTQWHRVVVWGNQAESCAKYLEKGRQVYVEGRLQTRRWEDKDGVERWTTEIVAQQVTFLSRSSSAGGNTPSSGYQPPADDDVPF
jgi:single-strand DNA-binding protein